MKPMANPLDLIQYIHQPAFVAENGLVIQANDAADSLLIKEGTPVLPLIKNDSEEYEKLTTGKLSLQLEIGNAWVTVHNGLHLFCVEKSYSSPELRAFALASQNLKDPLSNALSGAELLSRNETIRQDEELVRQLGEINRSLYQLIRSVFNMSDITQLGSGYRTQFLQQNIAAVFGEFFDRASEIVQDSKRIPKFSNLKGELIGTIDAGLLERLFLNLISNAIKFSPEGSVIKSTLKQTENRFSLTVENSIPSGESGFSSNAFSRFLREPGIENNKNGIGLGMSVISMIASAHQGTVLLSPYGKDKVRVTVSIPLNPNLPPEVRTVEQAIESNASGLDRFLIELSDVLPSSYYESL